MVELIRVLHVDDDPHVVELAMQFLEREEDRLDVRTETKPTDGLTRLHDEEIDCTVCDYDMPGMNGLEFLDAVRTDYPNLPFILFTGKGNEEIASEAISQGVTDYLQKDGATDTYTVLANRIVNAVERQVAQAHRRRQLHAIETANEGISILDTDGTYLYVNEAYGTLYGYEPDELLGEHWAVTYPDEDTSYVREHILPTLDEEGYWQGETTGQRADGSTFAEDHVLATTERGEIICTVRDLTTFKERTEKLQRYETIVECLVLPPTDGSHSRSHRKIPSL